MSDYIDETIKASSLTMNARQTAPRMYECTLASLQGSLVRPVEMRKEEDGPPTIGQLVYFLATRMQAVDSCQDFLEWVDETGRDAADPNALEQYRTLVEELDQFKMVLGANQFNSLMTALSIDQAISRARPR